MYGSVRGSTSKINHYGKHNQSTIDNESRAYDFADNIERNKLSKLPLLQQMQNNETIDSGAKPIQSKY